MGVLDLLRDILSTPAILVGLLAMVGLLFLKAPVQDVVSGTIKTITGFLIIGGGAGILIGALDPLGTMVSEGLGLQGVIPTNEAVVGLAQENFGSQTASIMGLAFLINLVLARITKLRYVFLTGHHVLFMSALVAVIIGSAGASSSQLIIPGALCVGSLMVLMPAFAMPFTRKVTDGDPIAVGHFGTLSYVAAGLAGKYLGDPEKSTEDVNVPKGLSFFRDTLVSTAVAMIIVYMIFAIIAGPGVVRELSGDTNPYVYAFIQSLTFAAGVWVILVGVRMLLAEIVPAFEGISEKLIPDALPALDIPIVFPYAPTAVVIGFGSSLLGGLVALPLLGPIGLALILPGMVPHFFVGGGAGVFGNALGGRRGAVIGAFVSGLLITFLPAFLLNYLGDLGLANTTFGDSDFGWFGLVLGSLVEASVTFAWVLAAILVAATFAVGQFFPALRPRGAEGDVVDEEADADADQVA
ncbi:PTS ascorbate transporter subunit IIC [Salsipaludibacter albus]|uniref:PTS ascorbate transporter subunit IIC n=1 Tax=Salsipaludibacter albus TaxID=2849650 RepID=UPI002368BBC9|nr:PTS ascorbate transporter subunit IIC [Salsipaludibacter albus]MBY5163455.1 PTS ascorbate transporter subunit IIC [Salsipaludibacter albus]